MDQVPIQILIMPKERGRRTQRERESRGENTEGQKAASWLRGMWDLGSGDRPIALSSYMIRTFRLDIKFSLLSKSCPCTIDPPNPDCACAELTKPT